MKKLFSTKFSNNSIHFSLLILRITAGGLIIPHGYDKLIHFSTRSASFTDPFGIGGPASMSLTIFAEFFCGFFVLVGLMTRLATIPLVIAMSVALFIAQHGKVFGPGENAALFLGIFVTLLFTGPGRFSIDKLIGK